MSDSGLVINQLNVTRKLVFLYCTGVQFGGSLENRGAIFQHHLRLYWSNISYAWGEQGLACSGYDGVHTLALAFIKSSKLEAVILYTEFHHPLEV